MGIDEQPVALPPGWARLSTKPEPTGSGTITNTVGTVRVACKTALAPALPLGTMTSGASAANSVAAFLVSAASPAPQRASICRLRPSIQPNCCSPWRSAAKRACASGSSGAEPESTPTRRMRSPCCARTASGHAAAPPTSDMNSRRFV